MPEAASPQDTTEAPLDHDRVTDMEALVAFLEARGITTRVEQAAAMGLGESGDVLIARYLSRRQGMRADVLRRVVRTLGVKITYDGYEHTVQPVAAPVTS